MAFSRQLSSKTVAVNWLILHLHVADHIIYRLLCFTAHWPYLRSSKGNVPDLETIFAAINE